MGSLAADIEPRGLCAAAIADLQREAATRGLTAHASCRGDSTDDERRREATPVPGAEQPALRNGRMTWPLRVGGHVRQVPLSVDLRMRAWVATRDMAAGESLRRSDLAEREVAWTAAAAPADTAAPIGRLAHSLRAGDSVSADQIVPPDAARRGDAVQIVLRQGPLELRVPGHLLAAARVGQDVRAQPQGRPAAISGVLTTPSTVEATFE